MKTSKALPAEEADKLLKTLKKRFETNQHRHQGFDWQEVEASLTTNKEKLWSLNEMEKTGGEPDVVNFDGTVSYIIFCDCAAESPKGRRSICYDREALESRKKYPPKNTVLDMAAEIGIQVLNEAQYRQLQSLEKFDQKTSSWLKTPDDVRKLGGAIFGDYRYGTVFIYHNGADSYYAARGFRGFLIV